MKLQDMTLQQLKEILRDAPESTALVAFDELKFLYFYDSYFNFWTGGEWVNSAYTHQPITKAFRHVLKLSGIRARIAELEPHRKYDWSNVPDVVNWLATDKDGDCAWGFLEEPVIELEDGEWRPVAPYTEIYINGSTGTVAPYSGNWRESLEQRQFKIGDRVCFIRNIEPFQWGAKEKVYEVVDVADNLPTSTDQRVWLDTTASSPHLSRNLCLATAISRIDEPASSCGMTAVEIDQFGEDLRNKPYVDLPEFEQPDSITAQLDPAKCRVVDPALPYDEPAKRRVGWVGCLGFGAIGDALQGNQSNFDAMSESHRSPGCKCHEFPIDAELKAPAGMKHDQSKPRYSLIPAGALALVVDVLEYGATKYAPDNWKHVENARERYYNASMRHIQAWWSGEQVDSESGLPHLAHAICSLMFLMALDGEQGE